MRYLRGLRFVLGAGALALAALSVPVPAWAQVPPALPPRVVRGTASEPPKPAAVERLGPDLMRIGNVTVDMARKRSLVPGRRHQR